MSDVRTDMRADGHMNLTWYCPYCDRRNRTHVRRAVQEAVRFARRLAK